VAPILLIILRIKLTRVHACHFLIIVFGYTGTQKIMYFPDRGCVHTILTLYVYATGSVRIIVCLCLVSGHMREVDFIVAVRLRFGCTNKPGPSLCMLRAVVVAFTAVPAQSRAVQRVLSL